MDENPGVDEQVGTGPGVITNDGCAVEFYTLLPAFGEPEIVDAAVPAGASILELGCGTGRILRPLAALGHPVTGVDDSPDMLARLASLADGAGLPTVCSPIQSLRLDRAFDAVLLASTMINSRPDRRREFLATVRHHLRADGVAVFQQHPPDWFETVEHAEPARDDPGGIRRIIRVARPEPSGMYVEVEYRVGDDVWTHAWTARRIGERELADDLAAASLRFGDWLTGDHAWFTARPA
ncbi:MAG: class I SAM-dependent methyltransferase [Nocardiopsaceae bacterium]|nr:class I SAM-dependent methyltransferase [Nocardiopsaceae bacterium]